MEEENSTDKVGRVKATNKVKKKSYGGFYGDFARWDVRGKSSKDLKLMVADLKDCITHQLVRIRKIKYVLEIYKARDVTKQLIREKEKSKQKSDDKVYLREKIYRRNARIDALDGEIGELELTIKQQDREIAKLNKELEKKEETLTEVRTQKRRGYTKVVKEKLTPEAKQLERIANNGVDTRTVNALEYTTRTYEFLLQNKLTYEQLTLIIQAEILGNIKTKDMIVKSYRQLNNLTEMGYLNSSHGLLGSAKYWFVSIKGKELIKKYKDKLSFGKSILTK